MANPALVFQRTKQPTLGITFSAFQGGGPRGPRNRSHFSLIKGGADFPPLKIKQSPKIRREGNVIFADFGKKYPLAEPPQEGEKEKNTENGEKSEKHRASKNSGGEHKPLFELVKQASRSKGLRNMRRGKFDPLWMVKWHMWYQYVIAMNKKPWNSSLPTGRLLTQSARAETAKIAWA
ncbi:hypothetical protein GF415_05260 [Candidatus Micrarchaeota archaeon]|nr:hypothetical protein [Candidatus Micrarchaeota archaeon]